MMSMIANRILLIALILLAVLAWIFPPFATRIKHKKSGIGEKVFIEIGGIRQGMIVKGKDMQNPILLFFGRTGDSRILFGLAISDFFRR